MTVLWCFYYFVCVALLSVLLTLSTKIPTLGLLVEWHLPVFNTGVTTKLRPTNSVIYGTFRYTQATRCCASYILLNRLGLGINSEFLCH